MTTSPSEAEYQPWAQSIREDFARRESATFVLHNNIDDVFAHKGAYLSCNEYLEMMLHKQDYIVIYYDVSRGMRFACPTDASHFVKLANQGLPAGKELVRSEYGFPREPTKALAFIEAYVVAPAKQTRPVAVVISYAEHVVPTGDIQSMPERDRINLVTLQRFSRLFYDRLQDSDARNAICFLTTPRLHSLHPDLVASEFVRPVELPRPNLADRERFARWTQAKMVVESGDPLKLELSDEQLAAITSGLTLNGIRHLFLRAMASPERTLSLRYVTERKRELIERDSGGMLKILNPKHGLSDVGGNEAIKQFFLDTAADLRASRKDVPAGAICPGPNGVGKTFIAKAFAKDCGVNCVSLGNFRGKYVGQTEANLDIVFGILKAMTPNVVIIDEADKMLGNELSGDSSGVDERVFGAFTAFMGDPDYRGRIFWLLLTARPFNLAPDTGRPGRVEEHVPILAPETFEDRKEILLAVANAADVEIQSDGQDPQDAQLTALFDAMGTATPAAMSLMIHRARRAARRRADVPLGAKVIVDLADFAHEARCFVGEGSATKLQLQTLEAVLYTNHLDYLPEPWRTKLRDQRDALSQERERLRTLVGYN